MTEHDKAGEWFRSAFQKQYLSLYAHRDEDEARQTVALIQRVTELPQGSRVLDAPCGAGRHAREFAQLGFQVAALDLSSDLLRAAVHEEPLCRCYVRADLRAIPFTSKSFDVVANLFSSFGYLASDAENFGMLRELVRVCHVGGWFVLDFFNATRVRANLEPESVRTTDDGWHISERRWIDGDPPRVEKRVTIRTNTGNTKEVRESVRLFTAPELEQALTQAGATVVNRFGDYAGSPMNLDSPRVILFSRRTR